jgi:outer membrane protein assembly factor BamB
MRPGTLLLLLALALCCPAARAEDWPQLLGPNRDNTTSEVVPVWKKAPRELWRFTLAEGNSNAVVADGRVCLHAKAADREEEEVVALDAATGKVLWRSAYPRTPYSSNTGNGPRTTPAVALGRVVAYGVTGILTCFAADTGKQLWQLDTHRLFQVGRLKYGVTSSPLIEGDRVLVHVGGRGAALAAFDLQTGSLIWKTQDDPLTTSAPILVPAPDGKKRYAVFQTGLRVVAVDPLDGVVRWQHSLSDEPLDSMAAPVWTGDTLICSSVWFGGRAFRVAERDGRETATEVWHNEELGAYFQSGVPSRDRSCFFMVTNRQQPGASLRCVDARTGKIRWSKTDVAEWHAGLCGTGDGKLLFSDGKGVLRLLAADPDKYTEVARAEVPGIPSSVNPVIANGKIYLRDRQTIVCLQIDP